MITQIIVCELLNFFFSLRLICSLLSVQQGIRAYYGFRHVHVDSPLQLLHSTAGFVRKCQCPVMVGKLFMLMCHSEGTQKIGGALLHQTKHFNVHKIHLRVVFVH